MSKKEINDPVREAHEVFLEAAIKATESGDLSWSSVRTSHHGVEGYSVELGEITVTCGSVTYGAEPDFFVALGTARTEEIIKEGADRLFKAVKEAGVCGLCRRAIRVLNDAYGNKWGEVRRVVSGE